MPAGTKVADAEAGIRRSGKSKGLKGRHLDSYVYGRLNNMGFMKGNKATKRGLAHMATHGGAHKTALT